MAIQRGEDSQISEQIKLVENSKHTFLCTILGMKNWIPHDGALSLEKILSKYKFDPLLIVALGSKNAISNNEIVILIAKLYLFLRYFIFHSGYFCSNQFSQLACIRQDFIHDEEIIGDCILDLIKIPIIEKIFRFAFKEFFKGKKFGKESIICSMLDALPFVNSLELSQILIDSIDFDSKGITNSVFHHIGTNHRKVIVKKLTDSFRKCGLEDINVELFVEQIPEPMIVSHKKDILISPIFCHPKFEGALKNFLVDSDGKIRINLNIGTHIIEMDENSVYDIQSYLLVLTKTQKNNRLLMIIPCPAIPDPFSRHQAAELNRILVNGTKISTLIGLINIYKGAVFSIENRIC
jgi:hypothetical protein